jgi:hypothetical protein
MSNPKAKRIFRFVSIRQGIPFSIRVIVMADMLAFRASSALLIMRDSLVFLRWFLFNFLTLLWVGFD